MGKIIEILGNSGSGKTTLVNELAKTGQFDTGIELHPIRPFHNLAVETNTAYALANQVDFLLYRAEQEKALRASERIGLLDGGLEQDFYLFSALFHQKGYLDQASFEVCSRLYHFLRDALGPPDLILWIDLPFRKVLSRFELRGRDFEITRAGDLERLDELLRGAVSQLTGCRILRLDGLLPLPQLAAQALQKIQIS